ncbi:MAG: hypothetical protein FD165_1379 [Gammaproteobacteria bacterium]|nr:MAG: hypothetical protein FD165_1379 [Gammaproteobacteria bacterium]TND04032.1 MAG: hypothetical protein FD120_1741 [Gammaproteobacteria bacterium]
MLDVLGLSAQISNESGLHATMEKYGELIVHARDKIFVSRSTAFPEHDAHHFEATNFVFDTLVLVSHSIDRRGKAAGFMSAVSNIMSVFSLANLPLRGAIGVGDYLYDDKTGLFLSDVFRKLDDAIKQQEWAGCFLLPEYEDYVMPLVLGRYTLDESNQSSGLYRYPVPRKDGSRKEAWCLNWLDMFVDDDFRSILNYMRADAKKAMHVERFITFYRQLPRDDSLVPSEFVPAKYAKIINFGESKRVSFWNERHESVWPVCKHFIFDPKHRQSIGGGFVGFDTEEERIQRERERYT